MILLLFGFLVGVSLIMIVIGLARPTESAQALIGFFFLFILALVIINGSLEYEVGSEINTSYYYDDGGSVNFTTQDVVTKYENFTDQPGENTAHWIGYYLALAAAVGFAGVLWSLKRVKKPD